MSRQRVNNIIRPPDVIGPQAKARRAYLPSRMMRMMLCMLAMYNKGLKIADNEGEMQGNRSDWK